MCTDCHPSGPIFSAPPPAFPCSGCPEEVCGKGITDAGCINYQGPDLPCIGATSGERLDQLLQKIDQRICNSSGGNNNIGNTFCLAPIQDLEDFIEKISLRYCNLQTSFDTFRTTTYPAALQQINTRIDNLDHPNILACDWIGFTADDTLKEAITKVAQQVCFLTDTLLDLSSVDWGQCITPQIIPVTLQEGFDYLIDQICVLRSQLQVNPGGAAITFDNTGTCLPSPGAADTLEATVIKIRSRLCVTPVFNTGNITGGCLSIVAADTLETVTNKMLAALTDVNRNMIRAVNPAQFTLTPIDGSNPCLGQRLSLVANLADSKVAVNGADNSPGTLVDKLQAGSNITLDANTVPGKMVISSTGGTSAADAYKVKTNPGDPNPDFLGSKVEGVDNTLVSVNPTVEDNKLKIEAVLNVEQIFEAIVELLEADSDLKARLCSLIATCPSPCEPPTNVQAIAVT